MKQKILVSIETVSLDNVMELILLYPGVTKVEKIVDPSTVVVQPFGLDAIQQENKGLMIIGTDTYNREDRADFIVCQNIRNKLMANEMCESLNKNEHNTIYYVVVEHNHRLCRGMEDLV